MNDSSDSNPNSGPGFKPKYRFILTADARTASQILALYRAAGWGSATDLEPDLVQRLIRGSHCFLVAGVGQHIIGMGRAISDGASDAYLQDVTVREDHRGQGIGRGLVRRLTRRLEADGIHWIGLIAENNSQHLYAPLGFRTMPQAHPMVKIIP